MVEGDGECGDVPAYDEAHEEVADQPTEEDEEVEDGDGHQADLEGGVGEGEGGHCKHPAHWTAQHPVGEDDILREAATCSSILLWPSIASRQSCSWPGSPRSEEEAHE